MANYAKLSCNIIHSSLWCEPDGVRVLFVTLIAMADRDGMVEASLPGIAKATGHTMEQVTAEMAVLMSPDPYSKNSTAEGKRVTQVPGGYRLTTFEEHREMCSREQSNEKAAARMRRKRARDKEKAAKVKAALQDQRPDPPAELFPDHPTPAQTLALAWMKLLPRYRDDGHLIHEDMPKWAKALEDITRLDKHSWLVVEQVVRWLMADQTPKVGHKVNGRTPWRGWFWVIQSPMKLRQKNRDGEKWFSVLLTRLQNGELPAGDKGSSIKTGKEDYKPEDDIGFSDD